MCTEIGQYFFILALLLFFHKTKLRLFCISSLYLVVATLCFVMLMWCYTCCDLSIYNIFTNSNANTPLLYLISATWSNHEGSLLLWCWLLAIFAFSFCCNIQQKSEQTKNNKITPFEHFANKQIYLKWRYILRYASSFYKRSLIVRCSSSSEGVVRRSVTRLQTILEVFFGPLLFHLLCPPLPIRSKTSSFASEKKKALGILVFLFCIFCVFLLSTSNPFLKTPYVCITSAAELNPVLQDPILAIHPPCIYAGYVASAVGFSLCLRKLWCGNHSSLLRLCYEARQFSLLLFAKEAKWLDSNCCTKDTTNLRCRFAARHPVLVAAPKEHRTEESEQFFTFSLRKRTKNTALLVDFLGKALRFFLSFAKQERQQENLWALIRFWICICWCFLTVGILLGSWWAYHELGWGGWWFWDPVENASLMPWLCATACIHSVHFPRLNYWTLCLHLFVFVLSILGTFFVRSGLLASVHSFATDSTRGVFILCFLIMLIAISTLSLIQYEFFIMRRKKTSES